MWLRLAKKGASGPTSLTYDEALDEALCHGWIDGQVRRLDEQSYRQRFTPRRSRSVWSKRNVGIAERLAREDRIKPAGAAAIEQAGPMVAGRQPMRAKRPSRCPPTSRPP